MLFKRRDLGSDVMNPIFVTKDLPVTETGSILIGINVDAYKILANWASLGRTLDNVLSCLSGVSSGEDITLAEEELQIVRKALCQLHDAIRAHYVSLPVLKMEDRHGKEYKA